MEQQQSEEQKQLKKQVLKNTVYIDKQWSDIEDLNPLLIEKLIKTGKEQPTVIQYRSIGTIISEIQRFVGVKAPNGSGKTLTYVVPALQFALQNKSKPVIKTEKYIENDKNVEEKIYIPTVIIIADTISLIQQIRDEIQALAPEDIFVDLLHTGEQVKHKGQILLSTPDLIHKYLLSDKKIMTDNLKYFVIDEADTTFKFFSQKVRDLINTLKLRDTVQMQLVSATLNKETINEFDKIIKSKEGKNQDDNDDDDDNEVHYIGIETTLEGVHQFYVDEDDEEVQDDQKKQEENSDDPRLKKKFLIVKKLIDIVLGKDQSTQTGQTIQTQIIIFFNELHKVQKFLDFYKAQQTHLKFEFITSDKGISQRQQILNEFRKGNFDLLFATNIIAHGIDIRTVGLVINLDCPLKNIKEKQFEVDEETYLHRVGRTGRYNDLGVGITLVDKGTKNIINKVKEKFNQEITKFNDQEVVSKLKEVIENNNKLILK